MHGNIAVLTIDNPPVNALGQSTRAGLLAGIERALEEPAARAVLLVGANRGFIAGADIREFGEPAREPYLPEICATIEACPMLVIASMHGAILGGGLEVALATDYRIAHRTAQFGFPEVRLGLIPGAGGTQRLPRLVGAAPAIEIITSGRHVPASEAHDFGLIDRLTDGPPLAAGLDFAQELLRHAAPRRPLSAMPPAAPVDWEIAATKVKKKARGQIAPVQAVRAIQASAELDFYEGLKKERQNFLALMQTEQRQALVHAFFAERTVRKASELKNAKPRDISCLGVVGGGAMGAGIATSALLAGVPVTVLEVDRAAIHAAQNRVKRNLQGAINRGKLSSTDYDSALNDNLRFTKDYNEFAQTDLVIEAVFEDMAIKQEVFARLSAVCKPNAILASNTSYLDVNQIALDVIRPERVIGLHFFSPAHVMKLLEIVVPDGAAPDAVAAGFALAKRLGKTGVRAGVCDGFIGNRIMNNYRKACDHMVLAGASPAQIDDALTDFGFAMGPYAVADLAGLDIGWANRKRLAAFRDPSETYARFPDLLCEAGHLGQKSGLGYYDYSIETSAKIPNPRVIDLVEAEQRERSITPRSFEADQIVRRFMAAMVNEAAHVLQDGIASRPLDVDVVLLAGYGFPRFRGGPCKWADMSGLKSILNDINIFAQEDSYFWRPAPLLQTLVSRGRRFEDLNENKN